MSTAFESLTARILNSVFNISLVVFITTAAWNTGWHMEGNAFALGPYLPWLELFFPISGLALWGIFFSQWALGNLRLIHISRWFYLLLFAALLMVSVLLSLQPEVSLSYLSIWLTASLALSLQIDKAITHPQFWPIVWSSLSFNLGLSVLVPGLIHVGLLLFIIWIVSILYWKQNQVSNRCLLLFVIVLVLTAVLPVYEGLKWLIWLGYASLWFHHFQSYRRKFKWIWIAGVLGMLAYAFWFLEWPYFNTLLGETLNPAVSASHPFWYGFGMGQFEWAQFAQQGIDLNPATIMTEVPFWQRWWYEYGLLMLPLVFSLWLLTLNSKTSNRFKSALFWGTLIFFPQLWTTTNGILLGAFWFFNREFWVSANQSRARFGVDVEKKPTNHEALSSHSTQGNRRENEETQF